MGIVDSMLPCDRLSNLPVGVSETILTYMPLRDAVRTSILSRKWRYVWTKLPELVLDNTLWENVGVEYSTRTTVLKILFQLLLSHDGPIIKFTLSNSELQSCTEIDSLILFLAKSHIEDFTLEMWEDCHLLPCSIFSCKKLRDLRLRSCAIRNFPSIGFSRLTSLRLVEVTISADTLATLISGTPSLGLLEIESSSEVHICIDAPNLKTIILRGLIKSIKFERVPVLSLLSILAYKSYNEHVDFVGCDCDMEEFFDCLPALTTLQLSYQVANSFDVQRTLPTSLVQDLVHLKLSDISFDEVIELLFTFCLLRSSPNLKYVEISIFDVENSNSEEATEYMEAEDYSDISLPQLREVKFCHISGTKPELEFIRLILATSSTLKKIQIQPRKDNVDGFNILKEVVKFKRLSREAEIIYEEVDHYDL